MATTYNAAERLRVVTFAQRTRFPTRRGSRECRDQLVMYISVSCVVSTRKHGSRSPKTPQNFEYSVQHFKIQSAEILHMSCPSVHKHTRFSTATGTAREMRPGGESSEYSCILRRLIKGARARGRSVTVASKSGVQTQKFLYSETIEPVWLDDKI